MLPEAARTFNGLGYDLVIGYGMTELGITGCQIADRIKDKLSLCTGPALPSVEYRIEPFEGGAPDVGELFVRSRTMHIGRLEEGKMVPPDLDRDGWFATGDIGRLEDGKLWIEGRLKEVIINESGENVYPDEAGGRFHRTAPRGPGLRNGTGGWQWVRGHLPGAGGQGLLGDPRG